MINKLTTLGKNIRKRPTDAEQLLWNYLRMKQMEGLKFRRQQPVDNYIVDFVCFENHIIIEVDGGQHALIYRHRKLNFFTNPLPLREGTLPT